MLTLTALDEGAQRSGEARSAKAKVGGHVAWCPGRDSERGGIGMTDEFEIGFISAAVAKRTR